MTTPSVPLVGGREVARPVRPALGGPHRATPAGLTGLRQQPPHLFRLAHDLFPAGRWNDSLPRDLPAAAATDPALTR